MDRLSLAEKFKVDKLEDYIISEFNFGREEAEVFIEDFIKEAIDTFQKIENLEIRKMKVLFSIITLKKEFCSVNNNFFSFMTKESIYYKKQTPIIIDSPLDVNKFADFILDYYDFTNKSNRNINFNLTQIRQQSRLYHLYNNFPFKSFVYFDILNEISPLEDFKWEWNNFEEGLSKFLLREQLDKIQYLSDCELQNELWEIEKKHEIESLVIEIDDLKRKVKDSNDAVERYNAHHNKFYYNSQIIPKNTFFGDNTPFLFNLFNFLKKNNLYNYGWSYFHSCMEIGNHEMIPLNKPRKSNFIGRIFYHLVNYLILHFKESPMQFIKAKFLIDETAITDSFKNNHMKPTYNKLDDPELEIVDDFFEKQKKIYLKS